MCEDYILPAWMLPDSTVLKIIDSHADYADYGWSWFSQFRPQSGETQPISRLEIGSLAPQKTENCWGFNKHNLSRKSLWMGPEQTLVFHNHQFFLVWGGGQWIVGLNGFWQLSKTSSVGAVDNWLQEKLIGMQDHLMLWVIKPCCSWWKPRVNRSQK